MTDEELAKALNIPVAYIPKIPPEKRAFYEHMIAVGEQADRYALGIDTKPEGVLLDFQMPGSGRYR